MTLSFWGDIVDVFFLKRLGDRSKRNEKVLQETSAYQRRNVLEDVSG